MEKEKTNYIFIFFKGMAISLILTVILIFITSILLCTTNLKENIISPMIVFSNSFSVLVGAFLITKKAEKNGILLGGILGTIYILIMYLISSIIHSNFSLNMASIGMIICSIVCGSIGGILGINMKK